MKESQNLEEKTRKKAIVDLERRLQENLEKSTRDTQDVKSKLNAALTKMVKWNDFLNASINSSSLSVGLPLSGLNE